MKTIYKYTLRGLGVQNIKMLEDAKILFIETQNKKVCIWAEVVTTNEEQFRSFEMITTGEEINQEVGIERVYLGSVKLYNDTLVLHVYERI